MFIPFQPPFRPSGAMATPEGDTFIGGADIAEGNGDAKFEYNSRSLVR
jgi:hypothetical protein